MLDVKILKLMFKEEFRLHASFFSRSSFFTSSLAIILFTFMIGLSLPMLGHVVEVNDMLLVTHWVLLFYGLGVGGFALLGKRIIERRFGSISLLLGSGYTLPVSFKRLFFIFYLKDTLYYVIFTILPMIVGLALASLFVSISTSSLFFLFVSLTLSFLLGISVSVLLFTVIVRRGGTVVIFMAAGGIYLGSSGIDINRMAGELPSFLFYYSHSFSILLGIMITALLLGLISSLFIKEVPAPHERKAKEVYGKTVRLTSWFVKGYGPALSKDIIDLVRSGVIFSIVLTFLMPLLFLYSVIWFIESVMLLDVNFSLLFYAAMVGFLCTLIYSWLSNMDISECYNSLPLSMSQVIRTKLILFVSLTLSVALPYLVVVGYIKGELDLLWVCLIILFTVSTYVGSVLAYLTGLFTNSYLLDAKILMQFALAVVPVLIAETLLSFYYTPSNYSIVYIAGLGVLLLAASMMILNGLNNRWKGMMFRIA